MSEKDVLLYFLERERRIPEKYLVYRHLREKGWVVKEGKSFGGDFGKLFFGKS
jgi:tRNA splicing endonuclease